MTAAVTVRDIPHGDAGTKATLAEMRRLVNASLVVPIVRRTATAIANDYGSRDTVGHAMGIRRWLAEHVAYVADPRGVELVHAPQVLLRQVEQRYFVQGDCDDIAVLGAALGKAIGLPAHFAVVGFTPGGGFSHVYTLLKTPRGWVDLDISRLPVAVPVVRVHSQEV